MQESGSQKSCDLIKAKVLSKKTKSKKQKRVEKIANKAKLNK